MTSLASLLFLPLFVLLTAQSAEVSSSRDPNPGLGPDPDRTWSATLGEGEEGWKQVAHSRRLRFSFGSGDQEYYRNPGDLFQLAGEYVKAFPLSTEQTSMSYTWNEFRFQPLKITRAYSEEKIALFKEQLKNIVRQVLPDEQVVIVPNDTVQLLQVAHANPYIFQRLLFLYPLAIENHSSLHESEILFQREALLLKIDSMSAPELDQAFSSRWKDELLSSLGPALRGEQKSAARWVKWVEKHYYRDLALPAFQMETKVARSGSAKTMLIERTPPLVALERGEWGRDCSRWSVPLYALSKGAHVYTLWLGDEARPSGYAFVVQAHVGGKILPYILTINGNQEFTFENTRAVVISLAKIYGTRKILLPHFSKDTPSVVNKDSIKKAMIFQGAELVTVTMPDDWTQISAFTNSHPDRFQYVDAYASAGISNAKMTDLDQVEQRADEAFEFEHLRHESHVYPFPDPSSTIWGEHRNLTRPITYGAEFEFLGNDNANVTERVLQIYEDLALRPPPPADRIGIIFPTANGFSLHDLVRHMPRWNDFLLLDAPPRDRPTLQDRMRIRPSLLWGPTNMGKTESLSPIAQAAIAKYQKTREERNVLYGELIASINRSANDEAETPLSPFDARETYLTFIDVIKIMRDDPLHDAPPSVDVMIAGLLREDSAIVRLRKLVANVKRLPNEKLLLLRQIWNDGRPLIAPLAQALPADDRFCEVLLRVGRPVTRHVSVLGGLKDRI